MVSGLHLKPKKKQGEPPNKTQTQKRLKEMDVQAYR